MSANHQNESVKRILEAAFHCFAGSGYHGTSLKEVAKAAGVSKALIHYHFETKESLLMELEEQTYQEVADAVGRMALATEPGLDTAMMALDELAEQIQRVAPLTPVFVELSAAAMKKPDLKAQTRNFMGRAKQLVVVGLHQTLGDDVARLSLPPERMAALILACLHGIALSGLYTDETEAAMRIEDMKVLLRNSLLLDATESTQRYADPESAQSMHGEQ
ncbi:MAG: TetR/AcrR family transcriptional regulator [Myxococcales bacterium]|nr:TetR/AcrR family transcriptional regulator [Myxococcales bacterium]